MRHKGFQKLKSAATMEGRIVVIVFRPALGRDRGSGTLMSRYSLGVNVQDDLKCGRLLQVLGELPSSTAECFTSANNAGLLCLSA
ncbi:hypothetical protein Z949_2226 [Sulfitobacter guttiformis KCTC 32187]|nr:hypothetical protein Z949_2226 [Sulfitobacter guttiformis KCTC 32187]